MEIKDILKSFERYDKKYKQQEVDAACARREEIIPHLLALLEQVQRDPITYTADDNFFGHVYAFMLLGHFKEPLAHDVLIDIFSLPGTLADDLFGDFITGNGPIVLLRTCGGKTDRIKELIVNAGAYEYCRIAGLHALTFAVSEGYIPRDDVLAFYRELFSLEPTDPESYFFDEVAACVCDLYPEELMDTINKAYEDNLILEGFISQKEFTEALNEGKEKCMTRLKERIEREQLDNVHDKMSWWACFNPEPKMIPPNQTIGPSGSKPKINKKKKKVKKKQAKASRKANRKKKK